jgi:hypothetical protein
MTEVLLDDLLWLGDDYTLPLCADPDMAFFNSKIVRYIIFNTYLTTL